MATVKTYDSRCYDLAEMFLSEEPGLNNKKATHNLALAIQALVEDEIEWMRGTQFDEAKEGK